MRLMQAFLATSMVLTPALAGDALRPLPRGTDAGDIHQRLTHANFNRDHVMVVAHRAGWKEDGQAVRAENSMAAIDNAARLGVEMVELDVRRARDGALVVMHDATLERTTTCRGPVEARTLSELRACRLVVEGSGIVTDERVPTLEEMLVHARDRILVNIDNKLEPEDLPEIARLARKVGMEQGVLLRSAIWNEERLERLTGIIGEIGSDMPFMPIIADDAVSDPGFVERVITRFGAPAAEMVVWHKDDALPPTTDGGALFSPRTRAVAIRTGAHVWINTYPITDRPEGMVAGGRGDGLAEGAYGFWIDKGATIIQTDEPKALIGWLETQGLRRPYALTN